MAVDILRRAIDHILRTDPELSEGTVWAYYMLERAVRHLYTLTVCAWCGAVLQYGVAPVSHGICERCSDIVSQEVVCNGS
jgi:hypothetical protein